LGQCGQENLPLLHFDKDQIPPVRDFWSLTMYNEKQAFAANPIDRYAIGDRDKLSFGQSIDAAAARELATGARWRPHAFLRGP
jgi:hypothetical protein